MAAREATAAWEGKAKDAAVQAVMAEREAMAAKASIPRLPFPAVMAALAARAATGARAPVAATEAAAATVATLHPMDGRPRATEVRAATPARPVIRMSSTVPAMAATEATEGAAWAAIVDPVASFNPVARVDRAVRPVSRRLRTGRLASPAIPANPERCDSREANLMRSHVTTTRAEIGARFHCADARSCV